jgi:repressor of nif and glnA expression
MQDLLKEKILELIRSAGEPLETKEIQTNLKEPLKNVTRTKVFYRLTNLRGERLIEGKFVGPGKGVWIWWDPRSYIEKGNKKGGKNE